MLVTTVIVTAILMGCEIPASASSGGKPPRKSPCRGAGAVQLGGEWRLTNPVASSLAASFPKACNLEIIVIITPHVCRALCLAF